MTTHFLDSLFNPKQIAVIGASDKPHSVGEKVFKNLLSAKFTGSIYAVNLKHKQVQGKPCYACIKDINQPIDLVVIATKAATVPGILTECGEAKVKNAIIISSGFSEMGKEGKALEAQILEIAKRYQMRLVGPNCLGVMQTHCQMNATFDNNFALTGDIAFVSQSGALSAAILDWAMEKGIGFSMLASLGNSADIGFGDVLEYLAEDEHTKSILLYIEGISNAKHFMTSLRSLSGKKPVIAIKAGRLSQGSRAALSHTGALIGDDDVFDAALKRAGVVRVMSIEELFSAAEILSSDIRVAGNRLAIITNGGGAGVMAADSASDVNVNLPALPDALVSELDKVLPAQWSHHNPIDIIGDATPERYHQVLDICAKYDTFDAALTMLVPVAMSQPIKVAEQIIEDTNISKKPILACWMGKKHVKTSWKLFSQHNIPCFDTPEKAVHAFSYLATYQENQQLLKQTPTPSALTPAPDLKSALAIINQALQEKRSTLTTIESKQLLKAFSIPVVLPINADSIDNAIKIASEIGYPIVMKINSVDISHKQDVGGVILNIENENNLKIAYQKMMNDVTKLCPTAAILGVTIEPMQNNPNNRELMIGIKRDIVFGPIISFGSGGTMVEVFKDRALALPPLNTFLVNRLINETKISKALKEFRHMPPINLQALIDVILRVSELVSALPGISEMDINPLVVNDQGAIALDGRFVVNDSPSTLVIV